MTVKCAAVGKLGIDLDEADVTAITTKTGDAEKLAIWQTRRNRWGWVAIFHKSVRPMTTAKR